MPMSSPQLSFACELDPARLAGLFADGTVIDELRALGARVLVMVSDLSDQRAVVIRDLNGAGVPLVGIPLFPEDEGYYFTVGNADRAQNRYERWKAWSSAHGLGWDWVGLDIEPDAAFYREIMDAPRRLPRLVLPRLRDSETPRRARERYGALIDRIHEDGWQVENYQFPLIADERRTGATLLQRLLGRLTFAPTGRCGCSTPRFSGRSVPDSCGAMGRRPTRSRLGLPAAGLTSRAIRKCRR